MTRLEYISQVMLKLRLWEQAEDTRIRDSFGRIVWKESFTSTELYILLTAAQRDTASVSRDEFNLNGLNPNKNRKEDITRAIARLESLKYLRSQTYPTPNNKTITRYFITDIGMNFINTIIS